MSENKNSNRINQEAVLKHMATKTPEKPKATALIKEIRKIIRSFLQKTEKYVRIRGRKIHMLSPTIDTGCVKALGIQERKEDLNKRNRAHPSIRPAIQHRERKKKHFFSLQLEALASA